MRERLTLLGLFCELLRRSNILIERVYNIVNRTVQVVNELLAFHYIMFSFPMFESETKSSNYYLH